MAGRSGSAVRDRITAGGRTRTGARTGVGRPDRDRLGSFLGMDRPIQRRTDIGRRSDRVPRLSGTPTGRDREVLGGRTGITRDRTSGFGFDRRPGRTGGTIIPDRRDLRGGRREVIGGRRGTIHDRPGWANISRDRRTVIRDRWNRAVRFRDGWRGFPIRDRWHRWGAGIRDFWWPRHRVFAHRWFTPSWWDRFSFRLHGWHYWPVFNYYAPAYWWSAPAWPVLTSWFTWPTTSVIWQEPIYYDYGPGGNVYYENNYVYVNDQPVATAEEFAESAAALATVPPPPSEEALEEAEWMPLGTFALSAGEEDREPDRIFQLAVNRDGIIGGTLYDIRTDEVASIQGQVDPETQRVAFRVDGTEDIVFETGLYNLTQDVAPVLMHFGTEWTEEYVLVRLDYPEEGEVEDRP